MAKKKKTALGAALQKMANKSAKNKTANKKKTSTKQKTQQKATKPNKVEQAKKAIEKKGSTVTPQTIQNQATIKKPAQQKKTNTVASATKAYDKGKKVSALGTKVETKTGTYKLYDDATVSKAKEDTTAEYKAAANQAIEEYVKQGYDRDMVTKIINKEIDKNLQSALNKIDKKSKVDYSYTPLTRQEYGQMEVGAMTGQLQKSLKSNKSLNKKVTDLNVKDYIDGAGVMGALDQATQGLSVSQDPTFNYSKGQQKIIKAQKQTGKYNVGRFVGAGIEFGLGGTNAVGSSFAKSALKTTGKSVLKELGEQGGKKLTKEALKNATKETAGDVFASSGLNILDSLKDSYKDGKYDKSTFWKSLALNTVGDVVLGGAISGITHSLSAVQVKNFNKITDKLKKGEALTETEQKFFDKKYKKIADEIEAEVKKQENEQQTTKPSEAVDNSVDNAVKTEQPKAEEPVKAEQPTVSKTEIVEPTVKASEEPTVKAQEQVEVKAVNEPVGDNATPTKAEETVTIKNELGEDVEVDATWKAESDAAATNPRKVYDNADERIRQEHATAEEFDNRVKKADRTSEVSDAYKNIKDAYFTTDELKTMAAQNEADGMFNKVGGMSQAEAREMAEAELSRNGIERMAEDFVNNELPTDGHITAARAEVILREMTEAVEKGEINTDLYFQVVEKAAIEFASTAGRNLNAVKMMYRATPEGRIRVIQKQAEQLSSEYASRLNGKKLELSDEQKQMIRNAKTEDEVAEAMKKINLQLWEQIPSSIVEKLNMVRRINMLFNIKTNVRNLGGNMALRGARSISDQIEYILTSKAFAKSLEKRGADSVMSTNVTRSELANARDYIHKEVFAKNYKNSNSKNRYVEMRRPDGSTVLTSKIGKTLEKGTFGVLEAGDIYPAFRPAYTKSYLRWCKHNKIDINNLDALKNMTEREKALANAYALKQAEIASFRDASTVANKLTQLKNKTESGVGKTVAGTAGLRLGNMALEAVLPFVKTPINVFRRSIDYSPISLLRATSDLATYAARKDTDALLNGIHHLSTGLTGTGVTLLGMWLASQGIVMVKAGEKSGDAFYDRDMGYQDYSLMIGGKSITIDWASPLQTSFFMGAQARNIFDSKDDDRNGMDYFNAALTLFEPHLDASFMSSAKDTLEMFAETAIGDSTGKNNWGEAILTTLGGTIPQNYMNTFLSSQILNQSAQAFDKYQRDTRSTKENPLAKSWESWGRKVANRFPVLRNELLNPKLNRRGENVKTQGDNILTRMFHAFINPSNVKTITFDELDKEIIGIYKDMEEGRDKNFYFYNFTGNPNYDLGNGKRMTYDKAYKYGKESRQQQTNMLKSMIDSPRYKKMTSDMKAKEVKDTHDIGNVYADRKTYGNKFAADRIAEFSETDGEARSKLKKMGGNDKAFVGFYLEKEKIVAQTHDTSYQTKAIAAVKFGDDLVSKAYGIWGDKLKTAKKYFKSGGSVKEYTNAMCDVISKIKTESVSTKMANKAVAAAYLDINERTYTAMGISEQQANMGIGLKKYGYSFEALETMEAEALIGYDSDGNNSLKKAEIIEYIDSLGIDDNAKKACIFAYFSDAKNPYGNIPNYLEFSNTSSSGGGGYRRSGGGSSKKSSVPSWENYVKDYITSAEKSSGVNFKDWDSSLDKSYQNKTKAIRKKMEV